MATARERVLFYSVGDNYGEFSNFAPYPIKLDGKTWPTSEHYFQAQKFRDLKMRERIRRANTPGEAARLGRSRKNPLRKDWESLQRMSQLPGRFPAVREGIRRTLFARFPYAIYFQLEGTRVNVLAVLHSRSGPEKIAKALR